MFVTLNVTDDRIVYGMVRPQISRNDSIESYKFERLDVCDIECHG